MLQGLRVDENPLLADSHQETKLDILYEDDYLLVINKPEGMLSVPGKGDVDSVYQRLSILYPEATGPIIVHRLDMATSGLLLAAKTKEAHQNLQAQFKNRTIQKRYIALLEGEVPQDEGEIRLPLCPDPLDRPRQIVSEEFGKPAFTRYRVLERTSGKTLIAFYPQTGRTHQLRVHAAHPLGLHCPILGDELYGRKAERLYLHAEYLAFTHPNVIVLGFFGIPTGILLCALIGLAYGVYKQDKPFRLYSSIALIATIAFFIVFYIQLQHM